MTSLRLAATATFGAVTDTMNGVASVTRGISKGGIAFDKYMDQMLFEQEEEYAARRAVYGETAMQKAAEKLQREEERLNAWFAEDSTRKGRYEEILAEVRAKVEQHKSASAKK